MPERTRGRGVVREEDGLMCRILRIHVLRGRREVLRGRREFLVAVGIRGPGWGWVVGNTAAQDDRMVAVSCRSLRCAKRWSRLASVERTTFCRFLEVSTG